MLVSYSSSSSLLAHSPFLHMEKSFSQVPSAFYLASSCVCVYGHPEAHLLLVYYIRTATLTPKWRKERWRIGTSEEFRGETQGEGTMLDILLGGLLPLTLSNFSPVAPSPFYAPVFSGRREGSFSLDRRNHFLCFFSLPPSQPNERKRKLLGKQTRVQKGEFLAKEKEPDMFQEKVDQSFDVSSNTIAVKCHNCSLHSLILLSLWGQGIGP